MRKNKKIKNIQRGQRSENLIHQYKTTQCPHCGRNLVYSNKSISALIQCNNCNSIFTATNPLNSSANSESLTSTPSTKKSDEKAVHPQIQTKQERTSRIFAPKLKESERSAMNNTTSVRRIEVEKPKADFHIVLAIISGMTVGLFATLLLKLVGS